MIKKFLEKWTRGSSEKLINQFLTSFEQADSFQNGMLLGWAAILHYQMMSKDSEFEKLLNSKRGENQGAVSAYILQLNSLGNQFNKAGRMGEAAGMKLWNITFRCMSDDLLHHYGVSLWQTAAMSFADTRSWLENKSAQLNETGSERDKNSLSGSLKIYNYIPPQFMTGNKDVI